MGLTTLSLTGATNTKWVPRKAVTGFTGQQVVIGNDPAGMALQVAVASWSGSGNPSREALKSLHSERQAKRLFPLVVAAVKADSTWVFGPAPEAEVVKLPTGRAARVLQAALDESTGLAARQRLAALQKAVSTGQHAGVVNQGLFASHYLTASVPKRGDWQPAAAMADQILGLRHEALIKALGYTMLADGQALLLNDANAPRAVAVLLQQDELFDAEASRFGVSPVAYGLRQAAKREVPWLLILRGSQLRLYPAKPGVGVGQKGQAETFFEMDLAVVDDDQAPLLPLVFSAAALTPAGSTEEFLSGSAQFAVELGTRLRARVYDMVIPGLARSVAAQLPSIGVTLDAQGLDLAYRLTMRILFRLLFQAYAEDRELLPYSRSNEYRTHSLKKWASDHAGQTPGAFDSSATAIWDDLRTVWKVIDDGNTHWQVPAYNGGLFSTDPVRHPEGAYLAALSLDDRTMATVLLGLLVDDIDSGGIGAVDFRSLSVREFGTIYEGLLESALSTAPTDLSVVTVKEKEIYAPAGPSQAVVVAAGQVYFHSLSGERKATGTYFTPGIVVEHLLRESLTPVVAEHLDRVQELLTRGDQAGAAAKFFDLRVADISMGSAHFLTAAIDHIEAPMRDFLTEHPIPAVLTELSKLEQAARAALGDAAHFAEIDTAALLRRQIARRCIYGLDINPMAVELARLAIWITTFVPGLPMSTLDHNLVCGNSLTGVGTIEEAVAVLDPLDQTQYANQISIYTDPIVDSLEQARQLLIDVANAAESTKEDVTRNVELADQARAASAPAKSLFDAVVAARLGVLKPASYPDIDQLIAAADAEDVQASVSLASPAHFPYLFPEVFLRSTPGFDVVLGNPPFDKLRHEPHQFWVLRDPGLHALSGDERDQRIKELRQNDIEGRDQEKREEASRAMVLSIVKSAYNFQKSQHYDLAKLFGERAPMLVAPNGSFGLVLPQAAAVLGGWAPIRAWLLREYHLDVFPLRNSNGWAFPQVDGRLTMILLSGRRGKGETVAIRPAASSRSQFIQPGPALPAPTPVLLAASEDASIPWFDTAEALALFLDLATRPNLGSGRSWIQGRADSTRWDFSGSGPHKSYTGPNSPGGWRVTMTRHVDAYAMTSDAKGKWLPRPEDIEMLGRGVTLGSSGKALLDRSHPPIVYRFPTNNDNSRTLIAALLPQAGWLYSKGYAHGVSIAPTTELTDVLALLGLMNSLASDWWARRLVDRHLGKRIIESLPMPDWSIAQRARVAELVAALVRQSGQDTAAGWGALPEGQPASVGARYQLLAEIDYLALGGLGLKEGDLSTILSDFKNTADAVPTEYREALFLKFREGVAA